MKKLVAVIIFLSFLTSLAGSYLYLKQFIFVPVSESNDEIIFELAAGKTFQQAARELEGQGLIKSASILVLYGRAIGKANKIKVGEYSLRQSMSAAEILSVLLSGKSRIRTFTVSEGLNIYEIAEVYERGNFGKAQDFLDIVSDANFASQIVGEKVENLEGYLYPETYSLTKYTTTKELITQMVKNFQTVMAEVVRQKQAEQLTNHQIVTLASIIEKETGAPKERPLISSVFRNRLQKGMLLQTDPTIIYGIASETKKMEKNISKADILRPTKYNTYVIRGLPPGPIANPGKESLLAAIKPEKSNFLFFVSHNDGTHEFSETLEQHNNAVKKFQLDKSARDGKSWRDLNKQAN